VANNLSIEKKIQILQMLCEGVSMRGISRVTGCSTNTVNSLLVSAGSACDKYQYMNVVNINSSNVQVDEIWAFCYAKAKTKTDNPEAGDVWTWTAVCPDTKMVICWYITNSLVRFMSHGQVYLHNIWMALNVFWAITIDR